MVVPWTVPEKFSKGEAPGHLADVDDGHVNDRLDEEVSFNSSVDFLQDERGRPIDQKHPYICMT